MGKAPKPAKGDKWKNPYLMNWPPSRGPMPAWMRRKSSLVIPEPERVDGPPPRRLTREERKARMERAKQFSAGLETPRLVAKGKGKKPRGMFGSFKRPTAAQLAKMPDGRPGSFHTNIHVETLAQLSPKQAGLLVYMAEKDVGEHPERPKSCKTQAQMERWRKTVYRRWAKRQPSFPMRSVIRTRINYPLHRWVEITVPPYTIKHRPLPGRKRLRGAARDRYDRPHMSEGYFLWVVAREYVRIYRQHRKYGVWGHAIGDLWFEGVKLLPKKRNKDVWQAHLLMGS